MGIIEIDPVQLLEDGLRAGIAARVSASLARHLAFRSHRRAPNKHTHCVAGCCDLLLLVLRRASSWRKRMQRRPEPSY